MKKFLVLLCLSFAIIMCFSSCGNKTQTPSQLQNSGGSGASSGNKNESDEGSSKGDSDCPHLWSNGYVDTKAETSKDAVLTIECFNCGEKATKDIITTVTKEEYDSAFLFETSIPTNFSMLMYEYDGETNEEGYAAMISDGSALHFWYDDGGIYDEGPTFSYDTYRYDSDYNWESSEDIFHEAYTEMLYSLLGPGSEYEEFYVEYPFDSFTYDEEEKCYYYSPSEDDVLKLYFIDGRFLSLSMEWKYNNESYIESFMLITSENTSLEVPKVYLNDLSKLICDEAFQNAEITFQANLDDFYSREDIYDILNELKYDELSTYIIDYANEKKEYYFVKELPRPNDPDSEDLGDVEIYIENGKIVSVEINRWAVVEFTY